MCEERSASKVNRVLYIPYLISIFMKVSSWKVLAGAVENWQVQ